MSRARDPRALERAADASEASDRQPEVVPFPSRPAAVATPEWTAGPPRTWTPLTDTLAQPETSSSEDLARDRDRALGVVFREAYEEGIRASKKTVGAIMERYHQAIAQLEVLRQEVLDSSQEDLAELALLISREVILSDDQARELFTFKMVEHALSMLRDADHVTLHVSPTDIAALFEKHPELLDPDGVVKVVEDRTLNLGGIVADSELGRVDASVERRLREAGERLRGDAASRRRPELGGFNDDVPAVGTKAGGVK